MIPIRRFTRQVHLFVIIDQFKIYNRQHQVKLYKRTCQETTKCYFQKQLIQFWTKKGFLQSSEKIEKCRTSTKICGISQIKERIGWNNEKRITEKDGNGDKNFISSARKRRVASAIVEKTMRVVSRIRTTGILWDCLNLYQTAKAISNLLWRMLHFNFKVFSSKFL